MGWNSVILALCTAAGWGGNSVATRFVVDSVPPIFAAFARFALAAVFMFFWCLLRHGGVGLNRAQLRPTLLLGFVMFVQIGTFNIAIWLSNASHGTMLINTATFFVIIIQHYIVRVDRLNASKFIGVLVAAFGTFLILATSQHADPAHPDAPTLRGDLVMVFSALVLGINIVCTRQVVRIVEPNKLIFWQDAIAMALLACWSLTTEDVDSATWPMPSLIALMYQGIVVGGVCFTVQAHLLLRYSAVRVSVFGFAAPLFGLLAAALLRDDPLSPWLFVAVFFLAWGIILVNRPIE